MNSRRAFPARGKLGFELFSCGAELPVLAEGRMVELVEANCASLSEAGHTPCLPVSLDPLLHAACLLRTVRPAGPPGLRRLEAHFA